MTAALASGLVLACTAGAAPTEQFTRFPRSGSINSSSDIPLAVDAEHFKMLTTLSPGVGFLLGGAIAVTFGPRVAFVVAAAGTLVVVAGVAALRPWRQSRSAALIAS